MDTIAENKLAEIDRLLDRLGTLHSPPAVALRVLELTRDSDFEMTDLLACLERDPALTASLLRLVNSSYYSVSCEVTTLQRAVTYLGRRTIRLSVLSFGLVHSLLHGAPAAFLQTYWRRSLTMAVAARKLAILVDRRQEADPDVAFTAGLLADIGMAALIQTGPEKYLPMCQLEHVVAQVQSEREDLGFDHIDVGARLLRRWNVPAEILLAVADHHNGALDAPLLHQTVTTSNLLAETLWTANSPCVGPLQALMQKGLGLDTDALITLAMECKDDVREAGEMFQVGIEGEIDIAAIERQAREVHAAAALEMAADLDSIEDFMADHSGSSPLPPVDSFGKL